MSSQEQWRAIGHLTGRGLGALVAIVRDTHVAVAERVDGALPAGAASAAAHRSVAEDVYDVVEAAHRLLPAAAGHVAAAVAPDVAPTQTTAGAFLQAAANGLWGDLIESEAAALAVPMAVRVHGADQVLTAPALEAAFPDACGDLVIFVHGLAEDEQAWRLGREGAGSTYGDRLAAEEGFTALFVRYNTGRHISDSGRSLDELLTQVVDAWPVPVSSLSLVGHSMGGLVARSAAHQADERGSAWAARLRAVVSLGSPHLGAPMERLAHVVDRTLRLAPESEPIGRVLASRSAGIRDLRYGAILEQDWAGEDPHEFLRDMCGDAPLLPHVTYCWVSASLTADPEHPLGVLLGDGLVRYGSASGNGHHTRTGFPIGNGAHIGGASHLGLLNHPEVYGQLRSWLASAHGRQQRA